MRLSMPQNPNAPTVFEGKSQEILKYIPDNTFDAIVTDPPYEINQTRMTSGMSWDNTGIAYDPKMWAEVLRVLKPGGNLVAFGAPRTYHRVACAIEDAGFEIRDSLLAWVKASGFPKGQKLPDLLQKKGETELATEWAGMSTALKPAHEPILLARKAPEGGTLLNNIILNRVGGINVDATRIPTTDDRSRTPGVAKKGDILNLQRGGTAKNESHEGGRWATNMVVVHRPDCVEGGVCAPDCASEALNEQSAGSSRYFPSFHYQGRAPGRERPKLDGLEHPSVKPLALMEWLVKLTAQPGQLILDPFAGSGATIEAAMRQGVRAVGIEMNSEYMPLIQHRVDRSSNVA